MLVVVSIISGLEMALETYCKFPIFRRVCCRLKFKSCVKYLWEALFIFQDLIKYTPASHPDHAMLTEALNMTQHFLDEFNIIQTKSMFPVSIIKKILLNIQILFLVKL